MQVDRTAAGVPDLIVRSAVPLNAETPPATLCASVVTPVESFFVRTHGDIPVLDPDTYRLVVDGDVTRPLSLSLRELREWFAPATVTATIACAGNRRREVTPPPRGIMWGSGAIGTATWTGVPLREVLQAAGVGAGARHVAFLGADDAEEAAGNGFGASVPLDKALSPEVLVAYQMNGAPLTAEHGFPVRVVVPGWIGARSVKWLTAITVQSEPSASFYQAEDYTIDGAQLDELPLTSAVCVPDVEGGVPAGPVRLEGYAMGAGGRPVDAVEISSDGGRTWTPAVLSPGGDPWAWRLWRADVVVPPGSTEVVVRARDAAGACQPEHVSWTANPRGYLYNAWPRVPTRS